MCFISMYIEKTQEKIFIHLKHFNVTKKGCQRGFIKEQAHATVSLDLHVSDKEKKRKNKYSSINNITYRTWWCI